MSASRRPSRGERNNNPFNLKYNSAVQWRDLDDPPSDGVFCRFKNRYAGVRAGVITLVNYKRMYGLDTVSEIIRRYAPPSENDTTAYVDAVCEALEVEPQSKIDLEDWHTLYTIARTIVLIENGYDFVPYDEFVRAMREARIKDPKPASILDAVVTDTGKGIIRGGVPIGAAGVLTNVLGYLDWRVGVAIVIAVTICAILAVLLWRARRD